MEQGDKVWERPWIKQQSALPFNYSTKRAYSSMNVMILWLTAMEQGYTSNAWLTFKQAKELGYSVKKGEKGTAISFYSSYKKESDESSYKFMKTFNVFNLEQTDIPNSDITEAPPIEFGATLEQIEQAINNMGVNIKWNFEKAAYYPDGDFITMPPKQSFLSEKGLIATLLHEALHATGHASRLDRDIKNRFGSQLYAIEELIAETASVFLQCELGIHASLENHACYLKSWIKCAKEDPKFLFKTMTDANKAVEHLHKYVNVTLEDNAKAA
jgi:antirestriction protein ArdC